MFQTLLNYGARVQMVDSNDSGGWVVDGKERIKRDYEENNSKGMEYVCWNETPVHQHYGIGRISCACLELCTSIEYQLTDLQKNQVSSHPFGDNV